MKWWVIRGTPAPVAVKPARIQFGRAGNLEKLDFFLHLKMGRETMSKNDFQVQDSEGRPMFYANGKPIMASYFDFCLDDDTEIPNTECATELMAYMDELLESALKTDSN